MDSAAKVKSDPEGELVQSREADAPAVELEDDGNGSTSSSSSEEVEPKLKYERLSYDMKSLLMKDAVSCIAFHTKVICIGTRWGLVHVLDHQGNMVRHDLMRSHSVAVNQISMDAKGEFVATCSDDGKAYIYGLYTSEQPMEVNAGRCIKSVAIDPYYQRLGAHRRFVTGDDRLVLHEKTTFLSRVKSTVLYEAVGKVQNIRWQDRFIAWACDIGVRVYDIKKRLSLVLIKWNRSQETAPENYPCCLNWKNNTNLLIGWVDTVRMCRIERRYSVIQDSSEFVVTVVSTFHIDYFVSGICPLASSELVILAYVKVKDKEGKALRPLMYVLQAEPQDPSKYVEVYTDNLSLTGYSEYLCGDYHLECLVDENQFIISSPKDVVIASVVDFDDRIEWLMQRNKFDEAMELATTKERFLQKYSELSVGKKYIEFLRKRGAYEKAAEVCANVLGTNTAQWEKEAIKFAQQSKLRAISQYLPTAPHCRLPSYVYEMVLYEYIQNDQQTFLKIIKEWCPDQYNIPAIINAVYTYMNRKNCHLDKVLLESLAVLYTHLKSYDRAVDYYLSLKHKSVFDLIDKHKLYSHLTKENKIDTIETLMELDSARAVDLFIKGRIDSDVVVSRLRHKEYYLFLYLDALNSRDWKNVASAYHGQLVTLYANFAPEKLLPLLRSSDDYPINEVLNICKERKLYKEMVFLLGKIGNTKEALLLLMTHIGDMEQAIAFCKEHDDVELWETLVECSLANPEYVTYLMQKISSYVDPRILVRRITDGMQIPGLKNSLVKMLRDYSMQISVDQGCTNIIVSDGFNLLAKIVAMQQRALTADDDLVCYVCHRKVIAKTNAANSSSTNVLMFYCKHSFHEECLPLVDAPPECIICSSQQPPGHQVVSSS